VRTPVPAYDQLAACCERAAAHGVTTVAITEHCNRFDWVVAVLVSGQDRLVEILDGIDASTLTKFVRRQPVVVERRE